MDERMKKLEEINKNEAEIKSAKEASKLMLAGGTDSDSPVAILRDNGNVTRQMYHAIGHDTLQSVADVDSGELTELSEQESLPHHNNRL